MSDPSTKTILIADDDRDLVNLLTVRCRQMGLNVLAAYDAFAALSLVKSSAPDMICLDVDMPAGNGLSVCEMLASDDTCRSIPIAILTGRSDPDTIIRCHSLCAYYIEKCPDVWSRVEPLLRELLGVPQTATVQSQSSRVSALAAH
jgi:DNA-binding response OmpR family regulator